jgi:signal transduction histidine kinase
MEEIVARVQATTTNHSIALRAPDEAIGEMDPLRIEQVVTNLLDNAIKYSPEGGRVEVELSHSLNGTLHLAVRDWGMGIPEEHRAHIFDRFHQVPGKHRASGMGLGLYISRQIVQLHGGEIEAEFPPDGGTRFVVTLPSGIDPVPQDSG